MKCTRTQRLLTLRAKRWSGWQSNGMLTGCAAEHRGQGSKVKFETLTRLCIKASGPLPLPAAPCLAIRPLTLHPLINFSSPVAHSSGTSCPQSARSSAQGGAPEATTTSCPAASPREERTAPASAGHTRHVDCDRGNVNAAAVCYRQRAVPQAACEYQIVARGKPSRTPQRRVRTELLMYGRRLRKRVGS